MTRGSFWLARTITCDPSAAVAVAVGGGTTAAVAMAAACSEEVEAVAAAISAGLASSECWFLRGGEKRGQVRQREGKGPFPLIETSDTPQP